MQTVTRRLDALERGQSARGYCQCRGGGVGTGWRFVEVETWRGAPPDNAPLCRVCGLRRPTVIFDAVDWRCNGDSQTAA